MVYGEVNYSVSFGIASSVTIPTVDAFDVVSVATDVPVKITADEESFSWTDGSNDIGELPVEQVFLRCGATYLWRVTRDNGDVRFVDGQTDGH